MSELKFKKGDVITRICDGGVLVTVGKDYVVQEDTIDEGIHVWIITDEGRKTQMLREYFQLSKNQIIYNIIQEL